MPHPTVDVRATPVTLLLQGLPGKAPTLYRRMGAAGEPAVHLLSRLLSFEPRHRASAGEALSHEYFFEADSGRAGGRQPARPGASPSQDSKPWVNPLSSNTSRTMPMPGMQQHLPSVVQITYLRLLREVKDLSRRFGVVSESQIGVMLPLLQLSIAHCSGHLLHPGSQCYGTACVQSTNS